MTQPRCVTCICVPMTPFHRLKSASEQGAAAAKGMGSPWRPLRSARMRRWAAWLSGVEEGMSIWREQVEVLTNYFSMEGRCGRESKSKRSRAPKARPARNHLNLQADSHYRIWLRARPKDHTDLSVSLTPNIQAVHGCPSYAGRCDTYSFNTARGIHNPNLKTREISCLISGFR